MKSIRIALSTGQYETIRQFVPGWFRVTISDTQFGQVRQVAGGWKAEVRGIETGDIVRYAGIWKTRREAVAELIDIRNGYTRPLISRRAATSAHCYEPE